MMVDKEPTRASPVHGQEDRVYTQGSDHSFYVLRLSHDCLYLTATGEPTGADLLAVLGKAMRDGPLGGYRRAQVDLSLFHGVMDWQAVRSARSLMGWEEEGHKVAYVILNEEMESWTKPLAPSFEKTEIATFKSRTVAQAWLDET